MKIFLVEKFIPFFPFHNSRRLKNFCIVSNKIEIDEIEEVLFFTLFNLYLYVIVIGFI